MKKKKANTPINKFKKFVEVTICYRLGRDALTDEKLEERIERAFKPVNLKWDGSGATVARRKPMRDVEYVGKFTTREALAKARVVIAKVRTWKAISYLSVYTSNKDPIVEAEEFEKAEKVRLAAQTSAPRDTTKRVKRTSTR